MTHPRINRFQPQAGARKGARHLRRLPVHFAVEGEPAHVPIRPPPKALLPKIGIQFPSPIPQYVLVRFFLALWIGGALATLVANAQATNAPSATVGAGDLSRVIEAAGMVEFIAGSGTNWSVATNGLALKPGDKVRTRVASRAAVQLSDRSVIRLSERTTLQILPPRHSEKKRFGLPGGSIFFFNREKPADIEFDTPLAAGAIRGTEFLLEVTDVTAGGTPAATSLHLALMDGLVALNTASGEVALQRGEDLRLAPGQPPQRTSLINAAAIIQWALYYPAVLNPEELHLDATESAALKDVLEKYRSGDLLAALAAWPENAPMAGAGSRSLHAQLELAVGRVTEAEKLLTEVSSDAVTRIALNELISTIRGSLGEDALTRGENKASLLTPAATTASEWLAHSYALQARADLPGALRAARQAAELAPQSGFAHARLAELEFSFGHRDEALAELKKAHELSPRLASADALQGFVLLDQGLPRLALVHFDRARELDAAFGPAWLGRGLCLMRERNFTAARAAFQAAAALEPQRALFRSYLGKAASELGDAKAAGKEFKLARQLDANDPTAWLYSALHLWQENRLNEAIRDLEKSSDLNDSLAAFRSRLLLDQDRAVRSANLAALYDDAGLPDVSRHTAAGAVAESYANFSGHLFLADSFASPGGANRFDLRFETARQSELLVANLLAPPGAGNLSQQLSQREHLQFFDQKPFGLSSLTEYRSNGDWHQATTVFGSLDGFSYALDENYEASNGQRANNDSELRQFALTLKQRVTPEDEVYFQIGHFKFEAGDVSSLYDPAAAKIGFEVREKQEPTLYTGWHHTWSPGSHTLLLLARLDDSLSIHDPGANAIFLRQLGGMTTEVQSPPAGPPVQANFESGIALYSAELQQVWESPRHSLIVGGRWQHGEINTRDHLTFGFPLTSDNINTSVERGNTYAYYSLKVCEPLRLIGGVSYDHLEYPLNADLPPLSTRETSRDLLSPKAGLLFAPWERGLFRASYAKSLGGLYFDNSVRLEPTQIGGFNQAFRSLIPESVGGLVPGTAFETAGVGFDQSFKSGTFFGVETEWLTSDGRRDAGVLTNSLGFPKAPPDSPASTRQTLDFQECNLSAYVGQLLAEDFSVGARYRLSEAKLKQRFPDIPNTATGLDLIESNQRATLHQLSLTANFHHRCGAFAQWESAWYHQDNSGYTTALADENLWQHNLIVGYRFPRRSAEIRLGLLNLFDADYRLNPLNLHPDLPRSRTLIASLRLNF